MAITFVIGANISACSSGPRVDRVQAERQLTEILLIGDCVSLVEPGVSEARRAKARKFIAEQQYTCPDPATHPEFYKEKIAEYKRNRASSAARNSRDVWVNVDGESKYCTLSGSDVWC